MKIRQATMMDVVNVTELWDLMNREIKALKFNNSDKEVFLAQWVYKLNSGNNVTMIAEVDGRMVGFIYGYITSKEYNRKERMAFCEALYVTPEHRGTECIKLLMISAIERAMELGLKEIRCMTEYDESTINFWKRSGFEPMHILWRKEV